MCGFRRGAHLRDQGRQTLGQLGSPEVGRLLDDPEPDVRETAAEALGLPVWDLPPG